MKITFTMSDPDAKKHSTRFNMDKVEAIVDQKGEPYITPPFDVSKWAPSIYVPNPVASKAKRIRVTIEELTD